MTWDESMAAMREVVRSLREQGDVGEVDLPPGLAEQGEQRIWMFLKLALAE